ncbi:hypothetical protein, partial [Paraburkholderia sp. J8-2]
MKAIHGLLAMLFLVAASLVNAADAPGATDTSTKPATLYRPRPVALGDIVAVTLKKQPCQSLAVVQKYRLLVNGAYTGIAAQGCQNVALPDGSTAGQIQFLLRKDSDPPAPETAAAWRTLIGEPWQG